MCLLHSRLGFQCSIAFDVHEWRYERNSELDLFATERGSGGQCGNLVQRASEVLYCFGQCRALQRALSRFAPQAYSLFDQASLGAVTRQQFGLVLGRVGELGFEGVGDTGVKRSPRLAQQSAISRVLHKCVLEQISRVRGNTLPKEQACLNEPVERRFEFRSGLRATAANRA